MANHGTFYWNELLTGDLDGAKAFYGEVLGWQFEAMEMADGATYWIAKAGQDSVGGLMAMPEGAPPGMPPAWGAYVAVDDVDASMASAAEHGATVVMEPFDVAGVGRIGMVRDPQGAAISFITPAT